MSDTQSGFFDSLVSAGRDNPLAAARVGGGAFWLLVGNDKLKSVANSATAAASPMVDGARNLRAATSGLQRTAAPPNAPEMDHEESFRVGETLREAGSAASDAMSGAADKMRDRFGEGVAYARETLATWPTRFPEKRLSRR